MKLNDLQTASWTLARRAERMNPSVIREILKVTERPGIVSLAGGLPSADTFPVDAMRDGFAALRREEAPMGDEAALLARADAYLTAPRSMPRCAGWASTGCATGMCARCPWASVSSCSGVVAETAESIDMAT